MMNMNISTGPDGIQEQIQGVYKCQMISKKTLDGTAGISEQIQDVHHGQNYE